MASWGPSPHGIQIANCTLLDFCWALVKIFDLWLNLWILCTKGGGARGQLHLKPVRIIESFYDVERDDLVRRCRETKK